MGTQKNCLNEHPKHLFRLVVKEINAILGAQTILTCILTYGPFINYMYMGLDERKPDFGVLEQQRSRPTCTSAQSDQHLCYLLIGKYHNPGSEFVVANTLAKWKKLEPNEIDFSQKVVSTSYWLKVHSKGFKNYIPA